MNNIFFIQLITSFLCGGFSIAVISLIAERVSTRVAGMILVFPSTVVLGFFFLGWTLSPEAVVKVIPKTLIPLGLTALFPALYLYNATICTKFLKKKFWQIVATFVATTIMWFFLCVILRFPGLAVGVLGYGLLAILAHFFLTRKNYRKPIPLTYTLSQKVGRAVFAGCIIFLVVFLGKVLNPFWGGIFSVFPVAISSSMMILHWYYDANELYPAVQRVPIGSIASLVYIFIVMFVFPAVGFILGTIVAYVISVVAALLVYQITEGRKGFC